MVVQHSQEHSQNPSDLDGYWKYEKKILFIIFLIIVILGVTFTLFSFSYLLKRMNSENVLVDFVGKRVQVDDWNKEFASYRKTVGRPGYDAQGIIFRANKDQDWAVVLIGESFTQEWRTLRIGLSNRDDLNKPKTKEFFSNGEFDPKTLLEYMKNNGVRDDTFLNSFDQERKFSVRLPVGKMEGEWKFRSEENDGLTKIFFSSIPAYGNDKSELITGIGWIFSGSAVSQDLVNAAHFLVGTKSPMRTLVDWGKEQIILIPAVHASFIYYSIPIMSVFIFDILSVLPGIEVSPEPDFEEVSWFMQAAITQAIILAIYVGLLVTIFIFFKKNFKKLKLGILWIVLSLIVFDIILVYGQIFWMMVFPS